ncbi:MAG TPA: tetratricopeptide repeat protein [Syntrophorhabdaceae bacterium]|nr:tetratricopeptide repeat protein [Syntrophorhabdaceae bacterium]
MLTCSRCSAPIKANQKFCPRCGYSLKAYPPVSSADPVPQEPSSPERRGPFPPELTASVDIHEKRISQDPLNPDLYIAFGGLYRDYKYYEEALVQYQKAVNLDPSRSDAHRLSGQAYLALGNYERAKVSFEKALSSTPDPEAQTGLFLALKGMDKTEDAIAMGSGLLAGDGRRPELYRAMADLYLSRGMEDDAISMLTSLAALSPDREVHREISRLYRKRSMPDEALLHAQKVLSLDPKDSDALLEAGTISREKGDLDAAGHYLEALLGDEPGHTSARAQLALVHADRGDLARAAKTLDALPPDAPSSAKSEEKELIARAYGKMGEKALASGDTIKAKEYLKASLEYAKDPEVSSALASIIGKEADNAFARQDYQGASLLYERAADLDESYRQKLSSTKRIIAGRMRKKAVMIGAPVLCVLLAVCAFFIWKHYTTGEVILSFCNADNEVEKLEIDGKAYKPEPQTIRLPTGEHKVFAKAKQGYKDDTSTYTLKGGEKKELYISLDKLSEVRQETGGETTGQAQESGQGATGGESPMDFFPQRGKTRVGRYTTGKAETSFTVVGNSTFHGRNAMEVRYITKVPGKKELVEMRYFEIDQNSISYLGSKSIGGKTAKTSTYDPGVTVLKLPLNNGASWESSYDVRHDVDGKIKNLSYRMKYFVEGKEVINTPGGSFDCHKIEKILYDRDNGKEVNRGYTWHARGIGIVKENTRWSNGNFAEWMFTRSE